jgi:hypothetical protein
LLGQRILRGQRAEIYEKGNGELNYDMARKNRKEIGQVQSPHGVDENVPRNMYNRFTSGYFIKVI